MWFQAVKSFLFFLEFKRNLVLETKVFKKGALAISNQFDLNSISESSDKRAHAV